MPRIRTLQCAWALCLPLALTTYFCSHISGQTPSTGLTPGDQSSTPTVQHFPLDECQRITLRTRDGYYLRAIRGGGHDLVANVCKVNSSEVFTLHWLSPHLVRLETREGFYVGARRGGNDNVDATNRAPRTSEAFKVEWLNESRTSLRLQTRDGFYVHPVRGGGGTVDAKAQKPGSSETLTIEIITNEPVAEVKRQAGQ